MNTKFNEHSKEEPKKMFKKKRLYPEKSGLKLRLTSIPTIVKHYVMQVKYMGQRAIYGYSDYDVWDIDYWFLDVVPNMLRQLAETSHSYPQEFENYAGWAAFLKCMADDFDKAKNMDVLIPDINKYREKAEEAEKAKNEAFKNFSTWFYHLWD